VGKEEAFNFVLRVNPPPPEREITVTSTTKDGHEVQATFIPNEVITLSMDVWYLEGRRPITRFWKLVFLHALQDGARKHFNTSNDKYRATFEARITTWWKLVIWATQILRYGIEIEPFAVIVCPDELEAPTPDTRHRSRQRNVPRVDARISGDFPQYAGNAYVIPGMAYPVVQVPGGRMLAWLANVWKGALIMSARKTPRKENCRTVSVTPH